MMNQINDELNQLNLAKYIMSIFSSIFLCSLVMLYL